jgi:hypothetical protein
MSLDIKGTAEFVGKILEVSSAPTPTNVAGLLIAFMNLFDRDNKDINAKLDTLITGPYKDGITLMENARITRDSKRRVDLIEDASKKFIEASNREEPMRAAQAKFYTGVCYTMLNDHELAMKSYREAYQMASAIEADMVKRVNTTSPGERAASISAFMIFPGSNLVVDSVRKKKKHKLHDELIVFQDNFVRPLLRLTHSSIPAALKQDTGRPRVESARVPVYQPQVPVYHPGEVYCPYCGSQTRSGGKFCKSCGRLLPY